MQILPSRPLKEIVPRKGATDGYRGRDEEGQGERRSRDREEEGELRAFNRTASQEWR